jgi:hypothetical protein
MPVFRGDDLWHPALNSLLRSRHLFDSVAISFDGEDRHVLAAQLQDPQWCQLDPIVLVTPRVMSSVEHAIWYIDQEPLASWSDEQLVMFMAEDDCVRHQSPAAGLAAIREEQTAVLLGSWTTSNEHQLDVGLGHRVGSQDVSTISVPKIMPALASLSRPGSLTSISGITLRLAAIRNYYRQLAGQNSRRPLLNGVRTEYFLATQPTITSIIQVRDPIFTVNQHADQEGRVLSSQVYHHDEALYQLWLIVTTQPARVRDKLLATLRLLKRLLLHPATTLHLRNAWLTYRETRNGLQS